MIPEEKINLKSIRKYNPGNLDDQDVLNNFIARKKQLNELLTSIDSEEEGSIPQHYIVIGQRGMGKTSLLKRIEVELKVNDKYSERFVPVIFPEEQYNIDRLSKFWINALDFLIDYIEKHQGRNDSKYFDEEINRITSTMEEAQLEAASYDLLEQAVEKIGKRPVLLIDNIDTIFDLLEDNELGKIRSNLSKQNAPIFISGSSSPFIQSFDYDKPFYDYFSILRLDPLSEKDFTDLLIQLADNIVEEEQRREFHAYKNRIKSLYKLTGGNVRTAIILFTSLNDGFGEDIADDLDELLDEMTPIYKARVEELSDQMRAIIDEIALFHNPINLEELANRSRIGKNKLSPQLKRLKDMGWVTIAENIEEKRSYYEIVERFFNVWYLMRRATRRNRRNISALSAFFKAWIDNMEEYGQHLLSKSITKSSHLTTRLAFTHSLENDSLRTALHQQAEKGYQKLSKSNDILKANFAEFFPKLSKDPLLKRINFFLGNKNYKGLEEFLLSELKKHPNEPKYRLNLGVLYDYYLKNHIKAEQCYLQAIEIEDRYLLAHFALGILYQCHLQKYEEAKNAFLKAIEIDKNHAQSYNALGNLYQDHIQNFSEAEKAYKKAIEIDDQYVYAYNGLGNLYQDHLFDIKLAKINYEKALKYNPKDISANYNLIFLLRDQLGEIAKAKNLLDNYELSNIDMKFIDSTYLHFSLFEVYNLNFGNAKNNLINAIEFLNNKSPFYTMDDWIRYAAVAIHKGFGVVFIDTMREEGLDVIMRPYYEACVAIQKNDIDHLYKQAVEVRETGKEVYDYIIKVKSRLLNSAIEK